MPLFMPACDCDVMPRCDLSTRLDHSLGPPVRHSAPGSWGLGDRGPHLPSCRLVLFPAVKNGPAFFSPVVIAAKFIGFERHLKAAYHTWLSIPQLSSPMSFSFSFAGDDIDEDVSAPQSTPPAPAPAASTSSAFPVQGKPQLPPVHHELGQLLAKLPSKIAYSLLDVDLDGNGSIQIPRRELWDVRLQLMAEEDAEGDELEPGLGAHDVKTGIYEGGFKSWESSVDLVKILAAKQVPRSLAAAPFHIIEVSGQNGLVFVPSANREAH